jgi:hypothetical protein
MLYEAILSSKHTDLNFFFELRGEKIDIWKVVKELNYFYKNDKETWIRRRAKEIKRGKQIQKQMEINKARKEAEQSAVDKRKKEKANEKEEKKRARKGKQKQTGVAVGEQKQKEQKHAVQRNTKGNGGIRIDEHKTADDEQIEEESSPTNEEAGPEIAEVSRPSPKTLPPIEEESGSTNLETMAEIVEESHPNTDTLVPEMHPDNRSRFDYAAYVYLVLKIRLEHSDLYKLINVISVFLY